MKKPLVFLIFLSFFIFSLYSQPSKKTPITKIKSEKKEIDIVQEMGEKWFKDIYVESFFKDPYSYKLLKTITKPVTIKEALLKDISVINHNIDTCRIAEVDRTQESHDDCMHQFESNKSSYEEEISLSKTESDPKRAEYHRKKADIYLEIRQQVSKPS